MIYIILLNTILTENIHFISNILLSTVVSLKLKMKGTLANRKAKIKLLFLLNILINKRHIFN